MISFATVEEGGGSQLTAPFPGTAVAVLVALPSFARSKTTTPTAGSVVSTAFPLPNPFGATVENVIAPPVGAFLTSVCESVSFDMAKTPRKPGAVAEVPLTLTRRWPELEKTRSETVPPGPERGAGGQRRWGGDSEGTDPTGAVVWFKLRGRLEPLIAERPFCECCVSNGLGRGARTYPLVDLEAHDAVVDASVDNARH